MLLDSRLALYHRRDRWLAVADLHYGFELSQRSQGRLVPFWGMRSIEQRLGELLRHYRPTHLLIVGDLVHDAASFAAASAFLEKLQEMCEVIVMAGNHDRHLEGRLPMRIAWETPEFRFEHGHCGSGTENVIRVIGHHHPAASLTDGAGLRIKMPAFIQEERCWILPAFSPWAGGVTWRRKAGSRVWLCTPTRVLELPEPEPAAAR